MTKIYGHRGDAGNYPENTILAFKKALEHGVEGIELDVHLTKDNEVVVIHDVTLDRTTTGTGFVNDYTLAELQEFSAGAKFADKEKYEASWDLEKIPTLAEVLELLKPYNVELNIELKSFERVYPEFEQKVLDVVKAANYPAKVVYSSFHLPTMLRIKKIDSSAHIASLLGFPVPLPHDYIETFELEALHIHTKSLLPRPEMPAAMQQYFFETLKAVVKNIRVWTANDAEEIQIFLDMGVEAIITDFPERALALREKKGSNAI
jgi:glycerophosphoryl diester phosphodiesterase